MTPEEKERELRTLECQNGDGERTLVFFERPTKEEMVENFLRGVISDPYHLNYDKRYKHNIPPIEKEYPLIKSRVTKDELKRMNQKLYSLVDEWW